MKRIKRLIYKLQYKYHNHWVGVGIDGYEWSEIEEDREGMEYWNKFVENHLAKQEKYEQKLKEL